MNKKSYSSAYSDIQRKNGSKGGTTTHKLYGSKHMSDIAKGRWSKSQDIHRSKKSS